MQVQAKSFVTFDRLLDTARSGPVYLRRPDIATLVREHLHALDLGTCVRYTHMSSCRTTSMSYGHPTFPCRV
jgi:hypothetical protein